MYVYPIESSSGSDMVCEIIHADELVFHGPFRSFIRPTSRSEYKLERGVVSFRTTSLVSFLRHFISQCKEIRSSYILGGKKRWDEPTESINQAVLLQCRIAERFLGGFPEELRWVMLSSPASKLLTIGETSVSGAICQIPISFVSFFQTEPSSSCLF